MIERVIGASRPAGTVLIHDIFFVAVKSASPVWIRALALLLHEMWPKRCSCSQSSPNSWWVLFSSSCRVTFLDEGDGFGSVSQVFDRDIDFTYHYASSLLKSASNAYGWNVERPMKERRKQTNSRLKWINQNISCEK